MLLADGADLCAMMETTWSLVTRTSRPNVIVVAVDAVQVRERRRGKRMTRKRVHWPTAWGPCPRWAKERLPAIIERLEREPLL